MTAVLDDIVAEGTTALGSFPAAYQQLTRVLADPNANAERIAAAIRVDPALTARLIGFVNASHLTGSRRVDSVSHAAMLVGRRQLRDVATASAVVHLFRGIPEHLVDMHAFWRHSLAVGLAASQLGRAAAHQTGQLFVPGLLHDMGALLLFLVKPDDSRQVLIETENRGVEARVVEKQVLGIDHTEVGAKLLQTWGLPDVAIAAARYHHEPSLAPEELRLAADFVHLADVAVSA
ncbi:MAG: HDOD domain-containing protein, partial [Myxococcota bacterium]